MTKVGGAYIITFKQPFTSVATGAKLFNEDRNSLSHSEVRHNPVSDNYELILIPERGDTDWEFIFEQYDDWKIANE